MSETWAALQAKVDQLLGVPEITRDIERRTTEVIGQRAYRVSQKGSGLARLMGGLQNLDKTADALATRLEAALGTLTNEMTTTGQIIGNVEQSAKDLQAMNRLYSNGGQSGN